jgi:3-dehydroquinate synthase
MSLTSDEKLFEKFEKLTFNEILENIEDIIVASIKIKKGVVEQDEKENGLRKVLNFGHTLGHGIESQMEMNGMFHGECVALGMMPVCSSEVRKRLIKVLEKIGITTTCPCDIDKALAFVEHDKKCASGKVSVIKVENVGSFLMEKITLEEFSQQVKKVF